MELIDGHPVVEHQIRFRLRTVVDERFADQMRDGETMAWIVKARCTPPQYYPLGKEGDERYKLAVQDVQGAAPLLGEMRDKALVYVDEGHEQLMLPFYGEDQVAELRSHLDDIGELREGERLIDTFRRLTGTPAAPPPPEVHEPTGTEDHLDERLTDPEYATAVERATAVLREPDELASVSPGVGHSIVLPDEADVEVVGSIYRGGRSDLSRLLEDQFGEHH